MSENETISKKVLAQLIDGTLNDRDVQKLQRMHIKDSERLQSYNSILQERVPWNDNILLRLTDHLYIVKNKVGRIVKCNCGHEFGDYRINWKLNANVRVRRTAEEFKEVYTPTFVIPEPEWMTIREYYCPKCASQLAVEVVPPGYPPLFDALPDIDGLYNDFLDSPLDDSSDEWFQDLSAEVTLKWSKEE